MSPPNRFFEDENEDELHPTARAWLQRIQAGEKATFTLWRKRDGLFFKPAKIYMSFTRPDGHVDRDHDEWDADLNAALIRVGVKAVDSKNEAQRLALMLRHEFSQPEERFGPGFFEAVLVDITKDQRLNLKSVPRVLSQVYVTPASRDGRDYTDCAHQIESIIKRAASSLTNELNYPKPDAAQVLDEALARYLDERFHVEERKMLGWK